MTRRARQLVLDDDCYVELTLDIPLSLYRTLHSYCVFREADSDKLPLAATAAIRAYFADNREFQAWRRDHPDAPVMPPPEAVRPARKPRRPAGDERSAAPRT